MNKFCTHWNLQFSKKISHNEDLLFFPSKEIIFFQRVSGAELTFQEIYLLVENKKIYIWETLMSKKKENVNVAFYFLD